MVTQEPMPGQRNDDASYWPQAYRIPQRMFFRDYLARHNSEARYFGHKWRRDKDDLVRRAKEHPGEGWDLDVLEQMVADNEINLDRADRENRVSANPRNEITAYDVWVPEVQLHGAPGRDEGYNGTIFTVVRQTPGTNKVINPIDMTRPDLRADQAGFVRKPRPFYGPRSGPYINFGVYNVPDTAYPLSPLVAVQSQTDDLNQHAAAATHADALYKRLVFVDNTDKRLVQRVKDAEDHYVVPVSGLTKDSKVVQIELGGSTPQQWEMIQQKRDRLDRNSGIFDAQRGSVAGQGTATEVAIADEASNSRIGFIKKQFQEGVQQMLQSVAHYLYHDDRVDFPLGEEAASSLGMVEPWFKGGSTVEGSGATFEDLELEIEPYSMERTNEGLQQKRTMEMISVVTDIAPLIPQMPWVNWKRVFSTLGDAMNFPELEQVIDVDMAEQMAGGPGEQGADMQPRLGRDAGAVGAYGQRPFVKPSAAGRSTSGSKRPKQMIGPMSRSDAQQRQQRR